MPIFKCALKVMAAHRIYIVIYCFAMALMGVFMGMGMGTANQHPGDWERAPLVIGVVDRDGSEVAEGLHDLLSQGNTVTAVVDETLAMQDAVAKNEVDALLLIPEGFGVAFVGAARAGTTLPEVELASSYYSVKNISLEASIDSYLTCVGVHACFDETASLSHLAKAALVDCRDESQATIVAPEGMQTPLPQSFTVFALFSCYPIMMSVVVLLSVTMRKFSVGIVRERTVASPLRPLSLSLVLAGAGFVCALATWAVMVLVGLIAFGASLEGIDLWRVVLVFAVMLAYAIFALAVGFLLAQLNVGEAVANAVGNIAALVFSFLGGSWVSLDLLSVEIQNLAHFIPNFWEARVIDLAANATGAAGEVWASALPDIGIVLLFALAVLLAAILIARLRVTAHHAPVRS